jgi:MFS family permease
MKQSAASKSLFLGSSLIVGTVLGFLWLLNINQAAELKRTFLVYVVTLLIIAAAALAFFYAKSAVFNETGGLERGRVIMIMVSLLIIVQITFAFANYSYRMMNFSFDAFDGARALYGSVDWDAPPEELDARLESLPEEIDSLRIVGDDGNVLYSNPDISEKISEYPPRDMYSFPLDGMKLEMRLSKSLQSSTIRQIMLDLFTVLVISLFFGLELVLLLVRIIEAWMPGDRAARAAPDAEKRRPPTHCVNFVRQISFLFYFGARFGAAFIPVMAAQLAANTFDDGAFASSLPMTAELLFSCVSIFLTSEIVIRFGWKQSFLSGLAFTVGGTLMSAVTSSFALFVASRAVVGLGYGFCWMTLRNMTLFGLTAKERSWSFSMFLAGMYAGMNCGQVMGSVLAETLGFQTVLVISALAAAAGGAAVVFLKNDRLDAPAPEEDAVSARKSKPAAAGRGAGLADLAQSAVFMSLLLLPSCITESFAEYFLPIYATNNGNSIADVGRVLLIYSLVIVYAGPKMTGLCVKYISGVACANVLYNLTLAAALIFFGLTGGFGAIVITVVMLGLADGFGFSANKDTFLELRLISRMPAGRGLSWYSFTVKFISMAGPVAFSFCLADGQKGVLTLGAAIALAALLAFFLLKTLERKQEASI